MGARGHTSILREAMKNLLCQHQDKGIQFSLIEQRFGAVDRCRIIKLLENMRQCGEARCVRSRPPSSSTWFPGSDDSDGATANLSPADWRRQQRARLADKADPLIFYGHHLPGGRCASVWEYAQRQQEKTV